MDTIQIETVHDGVTNLHIISDQIDMETAIIKNNQRHFAQVEGNPPTKPPLSTILDNGHNHSCDKILHGKYIPPEGIPMPMKCYSEEMKR